MRFKKILVDNIGEIRRRYPYISKNDIYKELFEGKGVSRTRFYEFIRTFLPKHDFSAGFQKWNAKKKRRKLRELREKITNHQEL